MDGLLKVWAIYLAEGVEVIAAIVVTVAAVVAAVATGRQLVRHGIRAAPTETRLALGRWLALGLEFELAADVLRTTAEPTWDDIARLAAIVAIRTAINFFLQRETAEPAVQEAPPR